MIKIKQPSLKNIANRNGFNTREVADTVELVKQAMLPYQKRILVRENGSRRYFTIERRGLGILTTKYGKFWQYNFQIDDCWGNYSVITKSEIDTETLDPVFKDKKQLTLRVDSGCETSHVFGDLSCECHDQLNLALKTIAKNEGMVINIPKQDGRGLGLSFKLATMWLQDTLKVNTVESASMLSPDGSIDIRTYAGAVGILKFFGIKKDCKINLASNNPKKLEVFVANDYKIGKAVPIVIKPTKYTLSHLIAKQKYLGHKNLV